MRPQVWAHRGACREAPENTLPAFAKAIEAGADGVELDVQRTADGILVVTHDETCDRLTGRKGKIADLDFAELEKYNFAQGYIAQGLKAQNWAGQSQAVTSWAKLPRLAEVLDLFRQTDMIINIELKNSEVRYPGLEQQVLDLVGTFGLREQVLYSSFNHASMLRIHGLDPAAPTGLLYSNQRPKPWSAARQAGAFALHPSDVSLAIPGFIDEAHRHGFRVNVWTVDGEAQWQRCADLGVDAVITNQPREALAFYQRASAGDASTRADFFQRPRR